MHSKLYLHLAISQGAHLRGFLITTLFSARGPYFFSSVGPNIATVGMLSELAICKGAESFVTTRLHNENICASCLIVVFAVKS